MTAASFLVEEFAPVENGQTTLVGFVRIRTPAGVVFHDVSVHRRNGVAWARPGKRPQLDQSGRHQRDAAGRLMWHPVISFASYELRERFSRAVIDALCASHPELLLEGSAL